MAEEKELDMVNRDPNGLHDSLTVKFEDVFGEPEGAHSPECAWKCAYKCYEGSRKCCYAVLTILCSWLCGLCWGCEFACITFAYVYSWAPNLKSYGLTCGIQRKFFEVCLGCCLGPLCANCGLMFSNIKVTQG
ncbi:caveolin-3-like [Watersipora subatra]|uniref:caveolin-3-like n=1 Tax=Watersipora subatra TaxID=2589382 RepID=UPI00355BED20